MTDRDFISNATHFLISSISRKLRFPHLISASFPILLNPLILACPSHRVEDGVAMSAGEQLEDGQRLFGRLQAGDGAQLPQQSRQSGQLSRRALRRQLQQARQRAAGLCRLTGRG